MSTQPQSAFVQIQAAIVNAVTTGLADVCACVQANRLRAVPQGKNAVVVRIEQSTAQDVVTCAKDWRTLYIVECYAHARPGADPLPEVDVLVTRIAPLLASLSLPGLGVINAFASGGIRWQFDDAADGMACAMLGFEVEHRTPVNSTAPWGTTPETP